jgi:hypothetical protein
MPSGQAIAISKKDSVWLKVDDTLTIVLKRKMKIV